MWRIALRLTGMAALIILGSAGLWLYQDRFSGSAQIQKLQQQKQELEQIVQRLGDERRVADLIVTHEETVGGVPQQTLLFVEYDRAGHDLPPKSFVVRGQYVHIDAMVIKFARDLVKADDPLRGHSIALFTRIYGDKQTPAEAATIDAPGQVPDIYRGADQRVTDYEMSLWKEFWQLADDPQLREKRGVRVASGEGPWGPFSADKIYTLTLDADGGLNLTSQPMRSIFKAALHPRANY